MATLRQVNNTSFDVTVNSAVPPILVDFYADWCGPCQALAPTLASLAEDAAGVLEVVKVDIDESPELASRFGVQKIPTLILFEGGEPVAQIMGAVPRSELLAQLEPFIGAVETAVH